MAIENINAIWKGLWAAHASPSSAVPPAITAADWDQKRKKYCSFVKPIADADAGTTYEWPFFSNLGTHSLVVTAATIVPFAALTADNSHYKTVALNRRLAAAAAVVIASRATTITDTGDWVALTPLTMTLSATAANRIIAPGEDLSLHLVDTGNGVAVPVLAITVEYFEL
jgi:hypothetical protein